MDETDTHRRPALREPLVATLKPGVTRLQPHWFRLDFEPGTTVLARDLVRAARASRPPKRDPDVQRLAIIRGDWLWTFRFIEPSEIAVAGRA